MLLAFDKKKKGDKAAISSLFGFVGTWNSWIPLKIF
jgi:hypothetical protein